MNFLVFELLSVALLFSVSALCRTRRNPHGPERYSGGSSLGPATIVAFGLYVLLHLE